MPITKENALNALRARLTKVEKDVIKPLTNYTWTRDLPAGNEINRVADSLAVTRVTGAGQGNQAMAERSWIADGANDLKGVDVQMSASGVRVFTAGRVASWTSLEVEKYAEFGLQLNTEKIEVINDIFQQEAQYVGYLGDKKAGITGLLNSNEVAKVTGGGLLSQTTGLDVAAVIKAIDSLQRQAEEKANDAVIPSHLLVSPEDYMTLFSLKMPDDNKTSLIEYIQKQSYAASRLGSVTVNVVKELRAAGANKKNRMLFYTPRKDFVKYNVLPMWREKTYDVGLSYNAAYLWRIAEVQMRHPETLMYADNV